LLTAAFGHREGVALGGQAHVLGRRRRFLTLFFLMLEGVRWARPASTNPVDFLSEPSIS